LTLMADEEARLTSERISFFQQIADEAISSGVFPGDKVILRGKRIPLLSDAYFILNRCYKNWRIQRGHWTEVPKIAALQSLAIMTFEPFRPLTPYNVTTVAEARCNEMYALNCAAAILGVPIEPDVSVKRDFWLRLLDVLSEARCQTLELFRTDINYDIKRPRSDYYRTVLDVDKPTINSLICIFELLDDKFKPI
jgi:hypothetical protein